LFRKQTAPAFMARARTLSLFVSSTIPHGRWLASYWPGLTCFNFHIFVS
jgi:hypothetical protein